MPITKRIMMAILLTLAGPSAAWAQCAPGVPCAGNPMGIPPDQPNSPYGQPEGGDDATPAPALRPDTAGYAAFVMDARIRLGWTYDQGNEKSARRGALRGCTGANWEGCRVIDTFSEFCGAPATDAAATLFIGYAEEWRWAEQFAVEKCSRESRSGGCRLIGRAICSGSSYSAGYKKQAADRAAATTTAELDRISSGYRPHR